MCYDRFLPCQTTVAANFTMLSDILLKRGQKLFSVCWSHDSEPSEASLPCFIVLRAASPTLRLSKSDSDNQKHVIDFVVSSAFTLSEDALRPTRHEPVSINPILDTVPFTTNRCSDWWWNCQTLQLHGGQYVHLVWKSIKNTPGCLFIRMCVKVCLECL